MVQNPYALTLTPVIGTLALKPLDFMRPDGRVVNASWAAVEACASPEVMSSEANHYRLQHSASEHCYPLALPVLITVSWSLCSAADAARTRVTAFVEWLYSSNIRGALTQLNIVALHDVSGPARTAHAKALDFISCSARTNGIALGTIIGPWAAGLAVMLLLLGVVGWMKKKEVDCTPLSAPSLLQTCDCCPTGPLSFVRN